MVAEIRCKFCFVTERLDKVGKRVAELVGELSRVPVERQALERKLEAIRSQLPRAANFEENGGRFGAGPVALSPEAETKNGDRKASVNYAVALANSGKEQAFLHNKVSTERIG